MKLPLLLKIFLATVILALVIGTFLRFAYGMSMLKDISDISLILTFIVLVLYTHYTYLIAKEAWSPCASFAITQFPNQPFHIKFIIFNNGKLSLNCWCKLNLTIDDKHIEIEGFYGGHNSFNVQPYMTMQGHLDLKEYLNNRNIIFNLEDILKNGLNKRIRLNVDFWYNQIGNEKNVVRNGPQPYYFDQSTKEIVSDF